MKGSDFAIILFYDPLDPKSVEVDQVMANGKIIMEEKIESGEWNARTVQFFRLNIDVNPELVPESFNGEKTPSMVIFSQNGASKNVEFEL